MAAADIARERDGGRRRIGRVLALSVGVAVTVAVAAPAPSELAEQAQATHRRAKRYCTKHSHPRGCIRVPARAHRPRYVDPQGGRALTPPDAVNGGGVGGGEEERARGALDWAEGQLTSRRWAFRDERFVEEAFGTRGRFDSAAAAARRLRLRRGSPRLAPRGALMLFEGDRINHGLGHVGISMGGGRMISALTQVAITQVATNAYWRYLYLGWTLPPRSWPGRLPSPPDLGNPIGAEPVEILAPAFDETVSGTVRLAARALMGGAVGFSAYYATDPARSSSLAWHFLGRATDVAGTRVLDWDTTAVPDQGNPRFGTVTIAAISLDAAGNQAGVGDYRRVTVLNGGA